MKSYLQKALAVASVALVTCALPASRLIADTVAYTTAPNSENDLAGYGPSGFEFTPNQNIDVTQLGYTPISLNGDHPSVTLWSVGTGGALTQIATTGDIGVGAQAVSSSPTGPNGADAPVYYVSALTPLPPIALTSGDTYLVTATAYWAPTFSSTAITTDSVFSSTTFLTEGPGAWGGWNYTVTNTSDFSVASASAIPTTPNFQYTIAPTPTPEPSTYALLGIGFAVLAVMLRRRATAATL